MREYRYLSLAEIRKYEPEMRRLGVSVVARGPGGFLSAFKRVDGRPDRLSEAWKKKRHAFISRHLVQYRANPTYRRKLALIAWSFMP